MLVNSSTTRFLSLGRRWSSTLQIINGKVKIPTVEGQFPLAWLRDSCQCSDCVHPSTKQKLRDSSSTSPYTQLVEKPASLSFSSSNELTIQWDPQYEPGRRPHTSVYPVDFLRRYSNTINLHQFHKDLDAVKWTAADVQASPTLFVDYTSLKTPSGLLDGIRQLVRYGLLFVRGVPNQQTSDDTCELQKLAQLFGEIRETFYGRVWDVKNIKNSKNIAYTNLNLDLHMDLLYFQHPPRFQILHCLRNRVQGGTSVFVDALKTAEQLFMASKESFQVLCDTPVDFHYINDGHHLHYTHPTIELALSGTNNTTECQNIVPPISFINYSPPFQAPLPISTPDSFYSALSLFSDLLRKPANRFEYTLKEGDAVMFDNRRVLHARTEFREWRDEGRPSNVDKANEGEASRWLKGCYLEADAVWDRMRVLTTRNQR
ncbi:Clavaminate synthase-like protein [Serendipita vermifera]|nr:Clavaminate synthase-like protein [Serendipita vermifera]